MEIINDSHLREVIRHFNSDLREKIGRFRVLIVGRANAGKTTILQKVCNTTDIPEIYDTKGKKIDAAAVKSSIKRGNHDITNEMVFKSNPGFVFHDSCGFEAGSEDEFETMKKFISDRVDARKLEERIHAIWYVIPMDDPWRTFQRSEEKFFFECNTGRVPVVVVFTKFEALRPVAFGEIKKQVKGLSGEERSERIAQRVEEIFTNTGVLDRLCDPKNRARPKCHVRLEKMNQPDTNCNTLLERTTLALDDEELQLCLISTQQSNMDLCIKCAVGTLVDNVHSQSNDELDQFNIAKWFPHLKLYERMMDRTTYTDYGYGRTGRATDTDHWTTKREYQGLMATNVPDFNSNLFNAVSILKDTIIRVLQPLVAKGSSFTAANRVIQTGIATIIVLEYSAFLPHRDDLEHVKSAMDYYLQCPMAVVVEKGAKEISHQGYEKEELGKKIVQFIIEHRMSKGLTKME